MQDSCWSQEYWFCLLLLLIDDTVKGFHVTDSKKKNSCLFLNKKVLPKNLCGKRRQTGLQSDLYVDEFVCFSAVRICWMDISTTPTSNTEVLTIFCAAHILEVWEPNKAYSTDKILIFNLLASTRVVFFTVVSTKKRKTMFPYDFFNPVGIHTYRAYIHTHTHTHIYMLLVVLINLLDFCNKVNEIWRILEQK